MDISHTPHQTIDGPVVPLHSVVTALPAAPLTALRLEGKNAPYVGNTVHKTKPLHPALIASGATLLITAFVTDIVYWFTLSTQ